MFFFVVAFKLRLEKANKNKGKLSSSCYVIRFAGIRNDVMALLAIVYVVCKFVALCYSPCELIVHQYGLNCLYIYIDDR